MDEHIHKFLELSRYVDYIKDERVKIQSFLGSPPQNFKERIKFVNPPDLDEAIKIDTYCYEQGK